MAQIKEDHYLVEILKDHPYARDSREWAYFLACSKTAEEL
jgi:hypothetical protein